MKTSTVPMNPEAEWMLLACCVEKPEIIPSIDHALFANEATAALFRTISAMPPEKRGHAEAELWRTDTQAGAELSKALNDLPSAGNWAYWRGVCGEYAGAREEQALKEKLGTYTITGRPEELAVVARRLNELAAAGSLPSVRKIGDIIPGVIASIQHAFECGGQITGQSTGFPRLDLMLNGLEPGRLYTVGARPSIGKSSLLLQTALNVAKAGAAVCYISLEMPEAELAERAVQIESQVNVGALKRGEVTQAEFARFAAASVAIKKLPLYVNDSARELHKAIGDISRAVTEREVKVVFVDYLGLLKVKNHKGTRNDEVGIVSRSLKQVAMDCKLPVVAASQVNRDSAKDNRPPSLHDLRDSGSVEQDSDVVLLLHPTNAEAYPIEVTVDVQKNRSGRCGRLAFLFEPSKTRFHEAQVNERLSE